MTIGTARLQALLREVASEWTADASARDVTATILMIVPLGEQHTLGALVAATWLRRHGVSVCMLIAPSPQDLGRLLQSQQFSAVFISIGSDNKLEVCAKLVKTLRALSTGRLPVVVGGALAAHKREDLLSIGADSVTTDLAEALENLGLGQVKRRLRAR